MKNYINKAMNEGKDIHQESGSEAFVAICAVVIVLAVALIGWVIITN